MHISVKWFDGKYPSFNINLHRAEGQPEFLSIKGCRLANGSNGEFVAMPSTKNQQTDKYWNHAWADEKFSEYVLGLAQASKPQHNAPQQSRQGATRSNDLESDIPFSKRKDY